MRWALTTAVLMVGTVLASRCTSDLPRPSVLTAADCNITQARFSVEVKAVFLRNCVDCHSAGGIASSVFVYETYAAVKQRVDNGKLLSAIRRDGTLIRPMPDGRPPIDPCDRLTIEAWVTAGALDN